MPGWARGCGLAAAVAVCLVAENTAAVAGPTIMSHLAVYRLGLDSSHAASGVAQANGLIEFEWAEGCDGWTINQRAQLVITDLHGNDFESGWILKAWESTDGLSYRFSVQSAQGGGAPEEVRGRVNTNSEPTNLEITDLRVARMPCHFRDHIIRLDTNQGISGYGEIRDGASPTYALMLKSRVLGENLGEQARQ